MSISYKFRLFIYSFLLKTLKKHGKAIIVIKWVSEKPFSLIIFVYCIYSLFIFLVKALIRKPSFVAPAVLILCVNEGS